SVVAVTLKKKVDGKGQPANQAELQTLGFTAAELARLAALYPAGTALWRVPITHFSAWDYNWPIVPPKDAQTPKQPAPGKKSPNDPCDQKGSQIGCQEQTLGEDVPVTGTPFTLRYQSERQPGYTASATVQVPLSGPSIPSSLKRITLETRIDGRDTISTYPAAPNQTALVAWDGKDAFGRTV